MTKESLYKFLKEKREEEKQMKEILNHSGCTLLGNQCSCNCVECIAKHFPNRRFDRPNHKHAFAFYDSYAPWKDGQENSQKICYRLLFRARGNLSVFKSNDTSLIRFAVGMWGYPWSYLD